MLTLGAGATSGFSAVLIPQLQNEGGGKTFSTELISWVGKFNLVYLVYI